MGTGIGVPDANVCSPNTPNPPTSPIIGIHNTNDNPIWAALSYPTPTFPIIDTHKINYDPIWTQFSLPMEFGGLNLRLLSDISHAAYLSSWAATAVTKDVLLSPHLSSLVTSVSNIPNGSDLPLAYECLAKILFHGQHTKSGIKLMKELHRKCQTIGIGTFGFQVRALNMGVPTNLAFGRILSILQLIPFRTLSQILFNTSTDDKLQRFLTSIIHEAKYEHLLQRARIPDGDNIYGGESDVIRLKALRLEGSSAFIQVYPTNPRTTYQKNSEVLTMLAQRVGLPLPVPGPIPKHCPFCSTQTDPRGYHFSVCRKRPIASSRHNRLLRQFRNLLPGGSDIREEVHGVTASTASRRPLDLSYDMQDGTGRRAGVDFTITYPSATHPDFQHSTQAGMRRQEKRKVDALLGSVNTSAIHYVPLVFTSFGGIGPAALHHFKELAMGWSAGQKTLCDRYLHILKTTVASCVQLNHASLSLSVCIEAGQRACMHHSPTVHTIFRSPITSVPDSS
jgi:hypothetical protein